MRFQYDKQNNFYSESIMTSRHNFTMSNSDESSDRRTHSKKNRVIKGERRNMDVGKLFGKSSEANTSEYSISSKSGGASSSSIHMKPQKPQKMSSSGKSHTPKIVEMLPEGYEGRLPDWAQDKLPMIGANGQAMPQGPGGMGMMQQGLNIQPNSNMSSFLNHDASMQPPAGMSGMPGMGPGGMPGMPGMPMPMPHGAPSPMMSQIPGMAPSMPGAPPMMGPSGPGMSLGNFEMPQGMPMTGGKHRKHKKDDFFFLTENIPDIQIINL